MDDVAEPRGVGAAEAASSGQLRFRILAALAHSWSTLMLEDDRGGVHVLSVPLALLTPIERDEAERLLADRTYRPWFGDRSWGPIARLPFVAHGDRRSAGEIPTDFSVNDPELS